MFRRSLPASSATALLMTLSPAAFSAAVVDTCEHVISPTGAAAGKTISKRDVQRLLAAARMDIAAAPLSLSTRPAGGHVTLTGIPVGATNAGLSETTFADSPEPGEKTVAFTASNLGAAPAPAPAAPERIGAASTFGAVPEPSSLALIAMGAMAFLRRRRG